MEQSNIRSRSVLIVVVAALLIWAFMHSGIRLGQDLKGGTTLRFALDIDGAKRGGRIAEDADPVEVVTTTLKVIDERINKYGLAETGLTQYGENKFEISLPAGSASQAEGIIDVVTQLGDLKFRIEVLTDEDYAKRRATDNKPPPERKGVWTNPEAGSFEAFKRDEIEKWRAARQRGEPYVPTDPRYSLAKAADTDGSLEWQFHVLEEVNFPSNVNFDGGILENPVPTVDQMNDPVVVFDVRNEFQNVFGEWTGTNVGLPMAIILNDEWHSAPVIQSQLTRNVQITLGRQGARSEREKEAKALATVLQTGSLKIRPTLEARNVMGASLAGESRDRGVLAVIVAFVLVLAFMVVYYRASGMIANVALLLNLVMLIGFLAFFQAVLTLPGIAGIVLTVGMAVDANILISERIREERRGGRTLRRAVSEGYDRALSAIVDANVTSLITAIFLYNFGSGPVRGFAVTLAIGLLVSMFTAIFVTRTILEGLIQKGWMKELGTLGSGKLPTIRWLALRRVFGPLSVLGVVFGLLVFWSTDRFTLYDVDFTGGYQMQASFHTPTTPEYVQEVLATQQREVEVVVKGFDEKTREAVTRRVTLEVGPYKDVQALAAGTEGTSVEIKVQRLFVDSSHTEEEQAKAFEKYMSDVLAERLLPDWLLDGPEPFTHTPPEDGGAGDDPMAEVSGGMRFVLAFLDPGKALSADTLRDVIRDDLPYWVSEDGRQVRYKPAAKSLTRTVVVKPYEQPHAQIDAFEVWTKSTTSGGQTVETDPGALRTRLAEYLGSEEFTERLKRDVSEAAAARFDSVGLSQAFPSRDSIGSSVAERLKNDAMLALFLSLVGIIIYIALRFHSRAMGFAAVLCLFHDVAITLGLVALANEWGIVDAKINLAMVAAFLTLVGYSVNDTVVVFDRIRENRGKRPTLTPELIEASINQTLARTIRTSLTFLLVCLALFIFNYHQRNVLEGFSFLLILGSIIGTYSTVAISTPLLLYLPWVWERLKGWTPQGKLVTACLTRPALLLLTPIAGLLWLAWAIAFGLGAFIVGLLLFVPWSIRTGREDAARPLAVQA